jgi:release factor glutamine methyltransferase
LNAGDRVTDADLRAGRALDQAAARLRAAGIEGARRDARILLAAALGIEPSRILAYPERPLSPAEAAAAERLIARRAAREPISRILGRREFWGLELEISQDTLDPRPDSEALVGAVFERLKSHPAPLRILDLGTGSGCLLLALLSELPQAEGVGLDVSPGALAVASRNATAHGLTARAQFVAGDWRQDGWTGHIPGPWQAIVSNPPYIVVDDIEDLAPEVARFDPRVALEAGPDGLASYRILIPTAAQLLAPGGLLALEFGAGQGDPVGSLLARAGFEAPVLIPDLSGTPRCAIATKGRG